MEGFDKKIRHSKSFPKDGGERLTVVEFSLTNPIRKKLKKALKPYVEGHITDEAGLKIIIERCFPKEVLDELRTLVKENDQASTVYVVRNLPEIDRYHDIPADLTHKPRGSWSSYNDLKTRLKEHSYSAYISKGIGANLGLKQSVIEPLVRDEDQNREKQGPDLLHKHEDTVSMVGGILTNGAKTRFTNFQSLVETEGDVSSVRMLMMENGPKAKKEDNITASLKEFASKAKEWMFPKEISVEFRDPRDPYASGQLHAAFERAVADSSCEEEIGPGALALWANHGRIFHQSRIAYGNNSHKLRAIISSGYNR